MFNNIDFNNFYNNNEFAKETKESVDLTKLINFENDIQERLLGQDDAIKSVSGAIKRSFVGLNLKKKPVGSFIFCGPTGVGKTEMAKTLAKNLYDDPKALIRFDMSEYMDKYSISKMLGTTPGYIGYEREGVLTQRMRDNPKSVLLFDEIEKSDKQIMDLFLQVLDEGALKDSKDNEISFIETVVVLTSNIGAGFIFEFMKEKIFISDEDKEVMNSKIMKELLNRFRPEFVNRLDQVVIFQPLVRNIISKILAKQLSEKKRLLEKRLNISVIMTNNAFEFLLNESFNLSFGARQISRTLHTYFETPLIDYVAKSMGSIFDFKNIKVFVNKTDKQLHFVS